jgi:transposase
MSARDRYDMNLTCPQCKQKGKVYISENDGWAYLRGNVDRQIDGTSKGFHLTNDKVICDECKCEVPY